MRPCTSEGNLVAGYATSAQVETEMRRRGFDRDDSRQQWVNDKGSVVTYGVTMNWLSIMRR